jgi:hypothetical protein
MVMGAVYDPFRDECFCEKGRFISTKTAFVLRWKRCIFAATGFRMTEKSRYLSAIIKTFN